VAPVAEVRQAEPRHAHEARDVHAEDGRLVLLARLVERGAAEREARIVDEDVEPAEPPNYFSDEAPAAVRLGNVELERDLRLEALDAARAAGHPHARLGERPCRCATDPRRGTRDDRPLPRQVVSGHGS
jgi:hypothetical protein